jgi:hypothetical protein
MYKHIRNVHSFPNSLSTIHGFEESAAGSSLMSDVWYVLLFTLPAQRSGVIGDEMMWNMEAYHLE